MGQSSTSIDLTMEVYVVHAQAADAEAEGMLLRPAYPAGLAGPLADLFNRRLGGGAGGGAGMGAKQRRRRRQAPAEEAAHLDDQHGAEEEGGPAAHAHEDGAQEVAPADDAPYDGARLGGSCFFLCRSPVFVVTTVCHHACQ